SWNDPPRNIMPAVRRIQIPTAAILGVAVEGSDLAWPGASGDPCLPCIDAFNRQQRYIDVFNRGSVPFEFTAEADQPWIVLSQRDGLVAKEQRLWVSVDWSSAPKGRSAGVVQIRQADQLVKVRVEAFNPTEVTPDTLDGFVETAGYVSIEAEHFTRNIPAGKLRWERIVDYGRTLSAMTIMPRNADSVLPPDGSPCLEYRIYIFNPGQARVLSIVAPTLNFLPDRGLRYAVSFDDEPLQIVEIVPKDFDARNGNRQWEESVKNACRVVQSVHRIEAKGYHTLKIWMVDPGVVLEKIVIDLGGLRPNYLGPPESFHH
ncbi:MAG: hypothetical protein QHH07_10205, partial [Sedimentisphaerales bacterium]|nr:hypothetical protein [Sedimentisphaerales bacterium]